jgi:hypothetical protein
MSACPPHSFHRCAGFRAASVEIARRTVNTEVEPLVPVAGAAAFLIVRSRSFMRPRTLVKESIEDQANRHL